MEDYQLTFTDYLAIAKRRSSLIAGTFFATLAVGIAVAVLIPPVYRASGTILIESQQIPTDLVQATVTSYADERIEVIKQRVMTRENLLRIIRKYDLFAGFGPTYTPSEQIDEMRKTIAVDLVNANVRQDRKGSATIAFSLSFEHKRPETAQAVANDLVTLFLDENVKVRTQRASQTTEFLTQESDKLRKELDRIEAQIAQYKQENSRVLPENFALGLASMQRVEADLRQVERDIASAEEELRSVEVERQTVRLQSPMAMTTETELQRARAEFSRVSAIYTDQHPDFKSAKRRLENLQQSAAAEARQPSTRAASGSDPAVARLNARATALRERTRVLASQRASLREKIGQMDGELARSPQTERALAVLTRDYQSAQAKYQEILAKKMTAQVAENLEEDQKAERFALLDPPTLPDKPVKPDRKKLLALSLMLSMVMPVGVVSAREALHGTVRGAGQISAVLGMKPLVTVPLIPVAQEQARRRRRILQAAGAGVLALGIVLLLLHFLVLPLDVLLMKAIIRLG